MPRGTPWLSTLGLTAILAIPIPAGTQAQGADKRPSPTSALSTAALDEAIVYTRIPAVTAEAKAAPVAGGMLRGGFGEGGQLVLRNPDGSEKLLSEGFHSAADPEVSFDGRRILFAAKRQAGDRWNIFEMNADGTAVRQITRDLGDCRSPLYLPAIFYLNDPAPLHQVAFVSAEAGELNELSPVPATNLYAIRPDGAALRRLTYNVSSSYDPAALPDGRILFSNWQSTFAERKPGRVELSGVHIDGADYAAFSGPQGRRVKHMATVTPKRVVIFVEGERMGWDGAGTLASISLRRNLKSYKALTTPAQGLFHSPSPLPDGRVLVSRRSAAGTHGVYRFDPETARLELVFDAPATHEIQARALVPRQEPDGHSSVVEDKETWSKLYCLNVSESDLGKAAPAPGSIRRIRVLEGVPRTAATANAKGETLSPILQRRFLGEVNVDPDGSFHLQVPPNVPIQLQALDENGIALRSSAWIWTKNREQRGCIGCHEDGERTPPNVMAMALTHKAADLTMAPRRRRAVEFERDIQPVLAKCASCHGEGSALRIGAGRAAYDTLYRFTTPGRARTSPVVWHLMGRNVSRPWDGAAAQAAAKPMPAAGKGKLSADDLRTIIEWIDLGAHYQGLPGSAAGPATGGQR